MISMTTGQFDITADAMQLKIYETGNAASSFHLQPHIPVHPLRWIWQSSVWKVNKLVQQSSAAHSATAQKIDSNQ